MFRVVKGSELRKGRIAAVEFEGRPYGAGVSFFQGNLAPGIGPALHRHPYPETCILLSGRAALVVDGQETVAVAGDVVVISPGTPHRFTAVGDERLHMVCIHASDHFIIDYISE